jgi:hypothetical protein
MAARWQSRDRPESLLVRGDALEACQVWQKQRKAGAPEVSDLVRAFLNASAEAETARTRKERQQLDDVARALTRTARAQWITKWALAAGEPRSRSPDLSDRCAHSASKMAGIGAT